jgi:hypothetical protein
LRILFAPIARTGYTASLWALTVEKTASKSERKVNSKMSISNRILPEFSKLRVRAFTLNSKLGPETQIRQGRFLQIDQLSVFPQFCSWWSGAQTAQVKTQNCLKSGTFDRTFQK